MPLLEVRNLQTHFATPRGVVRGVDGLSFDIGSGETVAIVGESGSGKSLTAMSILQLIPQPPGKVAGMIKFEGIDLLRLRKDQLKRIRGKEISMIFQEPMTALNPVLTVGYQIAESIRLHERLPRDIALRKAVETMARVGIPDPERRVNHYPHQFSGGMRQRVMIAIAIACNPKLLIADEPTTALDVTIQAQILDLIVDLKKRLGAATLLITHDLGIVARIAERVIVMYAGRKVEEGSTREIFKRPLHPYTRGLLDAIPKRSAAHGERRGRLREIPGSVSSAAGATGCLFEPRCMMATELCRQFAPAFVEHGAGHLTACHHGRALAG